jgi:hypothetical protein
MASSFHHSSFPNYDDLARLEYGRLFWKNPRLRHDLETHWTDARHPYAPRYEENRALIHRLLESAPEEDSALDDALHAQGTSLRAAIREIPPVFGQFWKK